MSDDSFFPLLEYDPDPDAVIDPRKTVGEKRLHRDCVLCFFREVMEEMEQAGRLRAIHSFVTQCATLPIYEAVDEPRVTVALAYVGGPGAAAQLDELIAQGCERFIVCGGAGVLRKDIAVGHLIIPDAAVRDEGTSFHYLPPSREVACPEGVAEFLAHALKERGLSHRVAKTWTTDAFYRETRDKVAKRVAEGCVTVEMEAAALFAVARFRGVRLGMILYGGDDVSGTDWNHRGWHGRTEIRRNLLELVLEMSTTWPDGDGI